MSVEWRNKSFGARETVHVSWIALFALRTNGKSADKVSRYSEIFFAIDARGWRQSDIARRVSIELKSTEAFSMTNNGGGKLDVYKNGISHYLSPAKFLSLLILRREFSRQRHNAVIRTQIYSYNKNRARFYSNDRKR